MKSKRNLSQKQVDKIRKKKAETHLDGHLLPKEIHDQTRQDVGR